MKLIDISRNIQDAPVYPGGKPPKVEQIFSMKNGDPFNASKISTGCHVGTHADATMHFVATSDVGIDKMPLKHYYGLCRVVTVPENALVSRAMLEGKIDNCQRLVIHGGGKSYLTKEAADYIVEKGVITVVTDAWSVAPLDNEIEIHQTLLGAGLAIVEQVLLDEVADGEYTLCAFPMKIAGCDGAFVRAVLVSET
ncbi:MAG: cyclase family protein [Spirochaetes bacterium]|nr:cyclase family protein [Spirochaetota bacterium]